MIDFHISECPLEPIPQLGLWRTNKLVCVYVSVIRIVIPEQFYCDLASVPNYAWPALDCNPNHLSIAGMVHDYLSRSDANAYHIYDPLDVTFDFATRAFNRVMEWSEISGSDRWKIVSAVKLNRSSYWHKKTVSWRPAGLH